MISGSPADASSGWTTDTLHGPAGGRACGRVAFSHHGAQAAQAKAIEVAFAAQQAAMAAALVSAEKAVTLALASAEKAVQAAMAATEKAVSKAETATEKRIEGLNELRRVVADMTTMQMPRAEAEQRLATMADQISDLKLAATQLTGRSAGLSAGWTYLVAAAGLAAAVVAVIVGTR